MSTGLRWLVVLVVCGPFALAGESAGEVRAFVEARLPHAYRQAYDVVLSPPPPLQAPVLVVEQVTGGCVAHYRNYTFRVGAGAVDVVLVAVGAQTPDLSDAPGSPSGCDVYTARIRREEYDSLLRRVLLLSSARLERRKKAAEPPAQFGRRGAPYGRVFLAAGGVFEFEEALEPEPVRTLIEDGRIDRVVRARLLFELVREARLRWKFRPANPAETEAAAAELLGSLPPAKSFRRKFRVLALGALGYAPAAETLRNLQPRSREIRIALQQIATQARCVPGRPPPAELLDAFVHPDPWLANWARELIRQRYGGEYGAILRASFGRAREPSVRASLLQEFEQLDPKDKSLVRLGLRDRAAEVRVEAARILEDAGVLLGVVRDKSFTQESDHRARRNAIIYLSWGLEAVGDRDEAGAALLRVALDEKDDVRVRSAAIRALGDFMDRRAIPALIGIVKSPVPARPVYLGEPIGDDLSWYLQLHDVRIAAAYALGLLRARAAVPVLTEYLAAKPSEYDGNLREEMGRALAHIGDESSLAVLETMRNRCERGREGTWDLAIRLLQAIRARDLLGVATLSRGSPQSTAALLNDLFTEAELKEFLATENPPRDVTEEITRALWLRGPKED